MRTLRVLDDARRLALHDSDSRVGGAQIDTDHGALDLLTSLVGIVADELLGEGRHGRRAAESRLGCARQNLKLESATRQNRWENARMGQ